MKTQIKNIASKILNWYNIRRDIDFHVNADYFNGSHNDTENIFIELKKLVEGGHHHSREFFFRRLNFLINEGIDVSSVQSATFRALAEEEYNAGVKKSEVKKVKKPKKVNKAYMPKRDKNGRFIARR
jgi:hypothetical protein